VFKKSLSLLIFTSAVLAAIGPVRANVRITTILGDSPRWAQMPIRYSMNEDGAPQIPNGSEFVAVEAALRTWASIPGTSVEFQSDGLTSANNVDLDFVNLITFNEDSGLLGTTTLAATFSFFQGSGENLTFTDSDIAFNPVFDLTTSGEEGAFDLQGVLTHESGHMLGLDHSGIVSSVMSPFAIRDQVDQRVLQYDDIAGILEIYPAPSGPETPATGTISGRVLLNGQAIPGAHVVAMDAGGTPMVSTMSDPDGTYSIRKLPPGQYRVYAEPLDGPVSSVHVPSYYRVNTAFGTTFFPLTSSISEATVVTVSEGEVEEGIDILALPVGTAGFNLTSPVFSPRFFQGETGTLTIGGENVVAGISLAASTPLLVLDTPTFGGRVSVRAPTSARIPTVINPGASLGPKTIIGTSGDTVSLVTGTLVVTDRPPTDISVTPSTGPFEGGTVVQIQGQDFRAGLEVQFGGLPATDVQFLNSSLLQVTVPGNSPGPANIQMFNSDGTSGLLRNGFQYTAPPPTVSTVQPASGSVGTPVVIEGANFDIRPRNVIVRFNGVPARVIASTRTRIETVVPIGATSGLLTVSVFGADASGGSFTVEPAVPSTNTAPSLVESIDATPVGGGTNLSFPDNDDGLFVMGLPFTFSLFTDTFTAGETISIATNGWLSLDGASNPEFQNASLPAVNSTRPSGSKGSIAAAMIAPFFDDLTFEGGGRVSTLISGSAPNRKFVVQWTGASILDEVGNDLGTDLTFQLVLYEGSNDVRFIYKTLAGPLSDGSSATIGMQNLARDTAIQTGFNQSVVESQKTITYRFNNGTYIEELVDEARPGRPVVTDAGALTASAKELIASWVTPASEGTPVQFDYAIGTTAGGTDIRDFTAIAANSVVATGLSLVEGATYYVAVRGRSAGGLLSEVGVADGIRVDTSFVPDVSIFPYVREDERDFGGIALMAEVSTDIVLRALDVDGNLDTGLGIRNPTAVHLEAGEQWARLIGEIFGVASFNGWVEIESSESNLRTYTATGARDLAFVDGAGPSPESTNFFLLHRDASAMLVNRGTADVTASILELDTGIVRPFLVPARSRRTTPLTAGPVRITSSTPLAGLEKFGTAENLALGGPIQSARPSLVFPQGVVGEGYRSWVTLANGASSDALVSVRFAGRRGTVVVAGDSTARFSIAELLSVSDETIQVDAVRIESVSPFSSASLMGVIDIELDTTLVTLAATSAKTEIVFPHVADLGGFFTGIALAAGASGAMVTIEVFTASGERSGFGTVGVGANGQLARLVRELIPEFPGQNGGYIRLQSDQPIWAWEIYGTLQAMASGPPL
jgi:hypothetical protein